MKILKGELYDNILKDVSYKVRKPAPFGSPVRRQIAKNFGLVWSDDNLIRLKIYNPKDNIGNDLNETT